GLLLGDRHPAFDAPTPATKGHRSWVGYRIASIERPTSTVMFADSARRIVGRLVPQKDLLPAIDVDFDQVGSRASASPNVHGRHGRNASVAWLDGRAAPWEVTVYADQSKEDRRDRLGFLDPNTDDIRENDLLFVR
ncbi:MAG: hypothetical protein AAFV30_06750, partial [Pseudomonadota bacterium]